MGIIEDIEKIIVPNAQKRIADEGISIKEALNIELKELGYIPNKSKE